MKVKWSGIAMTDGRGKINGSVASKNRAGAYVRTKVTPVNPNTLFQQGARNLLTQFSQAWRGLTQEQRNAWNAAVQDFASTDIFGDLRNPTGKNLYTRLNTNLINIGATAIDVPPLPSAVPAVTNTGFEIDITTPTYQIEYSGGDASVTVQVWGTPGLSPGISFVKSEYRLIGTFAGNAVSPYDFESNYTDRFGAPAAGTKVFIKLVSVNNTTGQAGTGSAESAIVTS
jgi:hypothetical protein